MGRKLQLDWITILLYLALVTAGWMNIYSASMEETQASFFDFGQIYFKQLIFIFTSMVLIVFMRVVVVALPLSLFTSDGYSTSTCSSPHR